MNWKRSYASPVGELTLVASAEALIGVHFRRFDSSAGESGNPPLLEEVSRELDAYFKGARQAFALPIAFDGTPFQHAVWAALAEIPYGHTWSYADLARRIGRPKAVRAVGAANGQNPLAIVLPCHRVIGANGKLTGYGGGMENKAWLLDHERRHRASGAGPLAVAGARPSTG